MKLIQKTSDIDAMLCFGKYNGVKLSELYKSWDGRNYMIFIIKNFSQTEVVDIVSNYYSIMITPLSFFEYFSDCGLYRWDLE